MIFIIKNNCVENVPDENIITLEEISFLTNLIIQLYSKMIEK